MAVHMRPTSEHIQSLPAHRPDIIRPSAPRRRRLRPDFVASMDELALDPAPLATTPNATLFRARLREPGADGDAVVVVKTARLASGDASRVASSDDPIRELHVAAHLADRGGHPNVVRCLGAFLEHDATHLVMEFCGGGDLFARLDASKDRCLAPRDALDALLQIARGLQFLHMCNVAHRDVSVENVLVGRDGVCKLCDFGLSTDTDELSVTTVGKAHYMAPEVVAKTAYDPVRADIWSLGILFFILLTGSPLVKIASETSTDFHAFRVLGVRGVLRLWKMDDRFSAATLDLLDGMLQAEPKDRFKDTTELLDHPALLAAAVRRLANDEAAAAQP